MSTQDSFPYKDANYSLYDINFIDSTKKAKSKPTDRCAGANTNATYNFD